MHRLASYLSLAVMLFVTPLVLSQQPASQQQQQQSPQPEGQRNLGPLSTVIDQVGQKAPSNKSKWIAQNKRVWYSITSSCSGAQISDQCAQAAIVQTTTVCGASGKYFQRATTRWKVANIVLILASAAFTAVGASTTIANAKIFATLGGTTGLGAVTTTLNANASADSAGITAVNTTLANFLVFLRTGSVPGAPATTPAGQGGGGGPQTLTPPDNATIFKLAPVFAAECEAAATSSSN